MTGVHAGRRAGQCHRVTTLIPAPTCGAQERTRRTRSRFGCGSFAEGVAIVAALPPYEGLVGQTLASIDGHPIADVIAALEPLMPRDNAQTVTLLTPRFLLTTEILHGTG